MKILIIHNEYKNRGGEEGSVSIQISAFTEAGHEVVPYIRKYSEIKSWRFGKVYSFFTALYNRGAVNDIKNIIKKENPSIAIINNLFPIISPAILKTLADNGVKILMVVHNYRLLCPTGLMFRSGRVCDDCIKGTTKEWNCTLNKCESSFIGSAAYSIRALWARRKGYYRTYVDKYIVLTDFQKKMLMTHYLNDESRYIVAPNPFNIKEFDPKESERNYFGFVGRLSEEKGVDVFFDIAEKLPDIQFKVAGEKTSTLNKIPHNVEILGYLNKRELSDFYSGAQAIILTSKTFEGFPLVLAEAAYHNTCVIAPRNGNLDSIYSHYSLGPLYQWGNCDDAAKVILDLFNNSKVYQIRHIATTDLSMKNYTDKVISSIIKNKNIKFSIITVCYNAAQVIGPTLESVALQSYGNIEYIIVDGASTDDTLCICEKYSHHISKIISEKDTGIYDAMNKGLKIATGDYVLFMNAGDQFYSSDVLESISNQLTLSDEEPNIIYGDTVLLNSKREIIGLRYHRPPQKLTWKSFRNGMLVCHQSFFVRREIAPLYNLKYKFSSDFDWCIMCLKEKGKILNSKLIISSYLEEGVTTQNHKKSLIERFLVMNSHYGIISTLISHIYIVFKYIMRR